MGITVKSFNGIRPAEGLESEVASRPYDVLSSAEARAEASDNPNSFYHIIKPEIDLPEGTNLYADEVYEKAKSNWDTFLSRGTLVKDGQSCMYAYRQIMGNHKQVGLVACSSIEDYFSDKIKKHEFTRPVKEEDRIRHMDTLGAHLGPVFLTYPDVPEIDAIVKETMSEKPIVDFTADDGVQHTLWVMDNFIQLNELEELFATKVEASYIADGHHRAASSAKVGMRRAEANPNHNGDEQYNFFLSVLFPASQLMIIDYNRMVKDLHGLSEEELMNKIIEAGFTVQEILEGDGKPEKPYEFGMYLGGSWYCLTADSKKVDLNDPIALLDISVLSDWLLDPILGIKDQRRDERIDFVGGIRGMEELEARVDSGEMAVAFAIFPVSIEQLMAIADTGNVMPPKSTWFEPKLRSGLVSHDF